MPQRRRRYTHEEIRESMRQSANHQRDIADEMSAMFDGCDDPMHPWMGVGKDQLFRDWIDFVEKVAIPLVEADGEEKAVQKAMALYRKENPYGICLALYFALKRIRELESIPESTI